MRIWVENWQVPYFSLSTTYDATSHYLPLKDILTIAAAGAAGLDMEDGSE